MRVVICVPTYNERENLEPLMTALDAVPTPSEIDLSVLIIDDNSPDGTGELADRLARERASVFVLHRPSKQGLGPAYLDGFAWALSEGADLVLEMDCDLSHDPEDVPRLIEAAREADIALGSRYVPGGKTLHWGALRRAISRAGSLYARMILAVDVHDLTGGFKCYRRGVVDLICAQRISSKGYAFQIETTYRALRAGFQVVEIPIVFADRRVGGSKMSRSIVLEAIVRVPALRLAALRGRL